MHIRVLLIVYQCATCPSSKYQSEEVEFLGVNVRDQASTAREIGATYPSIVDKDGSVKLSFAGETAPNAVPTTLVLDRDGRVAARVLGRVMDASILDALIDRVLEEPS
ncbi:TlpA family protein disulfide reductase [Paramicrobacterium agarici]|uniref:TlpA family protein disulfide reductase n=1 Tax=Paramicrobacterium agarici TaxID=630514 RepID=UPI00115286C0|nr:TlpA disulfide reductase family protein [Microbacterium agarici]